MPSALQTYSSIVYDTLISAGVPDLNAQIIVAQARHESSDFSSNVFLKDNNAFGLKVPHIRKSPYILGVGTSAPASEGDNYARYNSLQDCVMDLLNWLEYNGVVWDNVATTDDYAAWIKSKGYYGDSVSNYSAALARIAATFNQVYVAGITKTKNLFSKYKPYLPIAAGVLIAGIGLYIILKKKD